MTSAITVPAGAHLLTRCCRGLCPNAIRTPLRAERMRLRCPVHATARDIIEQLQLAVFRANHVVAFCLCLEGIA